MKRLALFAALLFCPEVQSKPVPKGQDKVPPKNDLQSLQGVWEMVSLEQRGKQAPAAYRLTIDGDKWLVRSVNGEPGAGAYPGYCGGVERKHPRPSGHAV